MHWEYLAAGVCWCLVAVLLDQVLQTHLRRQRRFWIFLMLIVGCQLIFDGYLTVRPVTLYDPCCTLGPRLPLLQMPVEEIPYGLMLASLTVILWEWLGRKLAVREDAAE